MTVLKVWEDPSWVTRSTRKRVPNNHVASHRGCGTVARLWRERDYSIREVKIATRVPFSGLTILRVLSLPTQPRGRVVRSWKTGEALSSSPTLKKKKNPGHDIFSGFKQYTFVCPLTQSSLYFLEIFKDYLKNTS